MLVRRASIKITTTAVLVSVGLLFTSASGQSPITKPVSSDKQIVLVQGPRSGNEENKVAAETSKPDDLGSEVAAVKAENAAFRESLRKMEEQQKALLEMVDRLQRKLDDMAVGNVGNVGPFL